MNAQCGAVRRHISLGSGVQAPNIHNSRRRACQKRESSRCRRKLAGLRAQFGECAMKGTLQPHPTLLAFTNINLAQTVTVEKAAAPILEGPEAHLCFRGPHFASMQCGSVRGRIPLCSCLQAPSGRMRLWWTYLPRESWRHRVVNIAYWRSLFANTQCEAVWRCITLGSRRHAPNKHHPPRLACQNRKSRTSTPRILFGESRSANYDAPPRSWCTCLATHQTHILHGQLAKKGNRLRLHPKNRFRRNVSQRTTTPPQLITMVSA